MANEERNERPSERDERPSERDERRRYMRELDKERRSRVAKIVVALILSVLFIVFIIRNSNPVSESDEGVDFIFATADVRLVWVFLVCAVIGGLVGYLLGRPSRGQRLLLRRTKEEASGEAPAPGSATAPDGQ